MSDTNDFKVEVVADSSGQFCGNGLTFATKPEAIAYAKDLSSRWMLVKLWRVMGRSAAQNGPEWIEMERGNA
jgi:hypothetical protein